MVNLIKLLARLKSEGGVSLTGLMMIIKPLLSVGAPPEIGDESALRTWILSLAHVLKEIAALTKGTDVDDKAIEYLEKIVNSSFAWGIAYKLIARVFDRSGGFSASAEEMDLARELSGALAKGDAPEAISPTMILSIVSALIQIIKALKE